MAQTLPLISERKQEKLTMLTQLPFHKTRISDTKLLYANVKCVKRVYCWVSRVIWAIKGKERYLISVFQSNERSIYNTY